MIGAESLPRRLAILLLIALPSCGGDAPTPSQPAPPMLPAPVASQLTAQFVVNQAAATTSNGETIKGWDGRLDAFIAIQNANGAGTAIVTGCNMQLELPQPPAIVELAPCVLPQGGVSVPGGGSAQIDIDQDVVLPLDNGMPPTARANLSGFVIFDDPVMTGGQIVPPPLETDVSRLDTTPFDCRNSPTRHCALRFPEFPDSHGRFVILVERGSGDLASVLRRFPDGAIFSVDQAAREELLVRVSDFCGALGSYGVTLIPLVDLEAAANVRVEDSHTGVFWSYNQSILQPFGPVDAPNAFGTCQTPVPMP